MKFGMLALIGPVQGADRKNFQFFKKKQAVILKNHKNRDITETD